MASRAPELTGALEAAARERVLGLGALRHHLYERHQVVDLAPVEPLPERGHAQRAALALLAPGGARPPLRRRAVVDPLADLVRRLRVHHDVALEAGDGLVGAAGIGAAPGALGAVAGEAAGALGEPAAALGGGE